tara:strand:+ start:1528 stop:2877 length:1350 start_codon:yes stop_codon:yes gene_type:complete
MKFTKKITTSLSYTNSKIIYDSQKSLDKKIDLINQYQKSINSVDDRIKILKLFKKFLINHKLNLVNLINTEAHKTKNESFSEFDYALDFVDYSINLLSKYKFDRKTSSNRFIFYKSPGSVFAITPYNDPLAGMTRKIAPSIASGSTLIMKTSSFCINLCNYFDTHLPKNLKNILQFAFIKNKKNIDKIIQNKNIKLITFTGSTNIGLKLDNVQTNHLQRKVLELGGINYALIFDKNNLDNVVDEILIRKIKAAGQACSSINKVFVHKSLKLDFEKIIKEKLSKIFCGSVSNNLNPHFGPLISKSHFDFSKKLELKALKNGKLIGRAKSYNNTNNLFPLTIVSSKIDDSVFDIHETFSPLLGVSYFSSNKKIFDKISRSEYSLVCYIFSNNSKIINQTKSLNFGSIGINTTKIQSPACPTGGNNLSGIGREGGVWGFEEFLTTVNYVINK